MYTVMLAEEKKNEPRPVCMIFVAVHVPGQVACGRAVRALAAVPLLVVEICEAVIELYGILSVGILSVVPAGNIPHTHTCTCSLM